MSLVKTVQQYRKIKSKASVCSILGFPTLRNQLNEFLFWILLVIIPSLKIEVLFFLINSLCTVSIDSPFHCNDTQQINTGEGAGGDQNKWEVATEVLNFPKDLGLNVRGHNQRS